MRGFARNRSRYNIQLQDLQGKFHLLDAEEISQIAMESGSMMPAPRCSAGTVQRLACIPQLINRTSGRSLG